ESDLWSDLSRVTLGDGGILVVGLYSNDKRHHVIREQLARHGAVDFSHVVHPHLTPIVRKITVRAREAFRGGLENPETGEVTWHDVPARRAGVEKWTVNKRFHLGSRRNLQLLTAAINERATVKSIMKSYSDEETAGCPISAVLIMEPNLDEGDLTYLHDFRAA